MTFPGEWAFNSATETRHPTNATSPETIAPMIAEPSGDRQARETAKYATVTQARVQIEIAAIHP
jgi:hypothetical protein